MYRWVDSNWYSLYKQNSPRSHHLHTNTPTPQFSNKGSLHHRINYLQNIEVWNNCFHWVGRANTRIHIPYNDVSRAAMLTYCKRGSCPSTPSLDIQHVSRLGCTQPRLGKTFPHHQILGKKKISSEMFLVSELTLTETGGCTSNNKQCKCCYLHTEVRHTAGHKGIWINVFMTWQKREEEKCTAFLYGILHIFTVNKAW